MAKLLHAGAKPRALTLGQAKTSPTSPVGSGNKRRVPKPTTRGRTGTLKTRANAPQAQSVNDLVNPAGMKRTKPKSYVYPAQGHRGTGNPYSATPGSGYFSG